MDIISFDTAPAISPWLPATRCTIDPMLLSFASVFTSEPQPPGRSNTVPNATSERTIASVSTCRIRYRTYHVNSSIATNDENVVACIHVLRMAVATESLTFLLLDVAHFSAQTRILFIKLQEGNVHAILVIVVLRLWFLHYYIIVVDVLCIIEDDDHNDVTDSDQRSRWRNA